MTKVGAIILAAGASRRMGKPKLLLKVEGKTIIARQLALLSSAGIWQTAVVMRPYDRELLAEVDACEDPPTFIVENATKDPDDMFSSVLRGLSKPRWDEKITHLGIFLADQILLRKRTVQKLIAWSEAHPDRIIQPAYAGRRGHPIFIPRKYVKPIVNGQAKSLRDALRVLQTGRSSLTVDDPGILFDVDTPEDFHKALACMQDRPPSTG